VPFRPPVVFAIFLFAVLAGEGEEGPYVAVFVCAVGADGFDIALGHVFGFCDCGGVALVEFAGG